MSLNSLNLICLALAGPALAMTVLLTIQNWENRRYLRKNCRRERLLPDPPRVAVVAPVKGIDLELESSLRAILNQDYSNYEVHFVGESDDDPAHAVIQRLMAESNRAPAHWHSAGLAERCGQKVHYLSHVARQLDSGVELVAFIDSDSHPGPQWLHYLAYRLAKTNQRQGAVTGYRVLVPEKTSLANSLAYSINSSVAALLVGSSPFNIIWGGSWIVRQSVLREHLLPAWEKVVTEDVVATRVIRSIGKRVGFEANIMVPSACDFTLSGFFEFMRRQFYMVRHYSSRMWLANLVASTTMIAAFWLAVALCAWGLATANPAWWQPAAVAGAFYGIGLFRVKLRQSACNHCLPQLKPLLRKARRLELWGHPLVSLIAWVGVVASTIGAAVTWRGIRYRVNSGGEVVQLDHLSQRVRDDGQAGSRRAA